MNSYLRDGERFDSSLPFIRRSGLLEAPLQHTRRGITTLDDERCFSHIAPTAPPYPRDTVPYTRECAPAFYPRPPSPTNNARKHVNELQDQVHILRDELSKRDRLVTQLTSIDGPRQKPSYDTAHVDEFYSNDRLNALAATKSENAALQIKVEGLQSQLRETQAQLEARTDKLREQKLQLETLKENESKQLTLVQSLRQKLVQYEAQYGSLEGMASRSEFAIQSLQNENKTSQERILELESRLRTHLEERESAEQEKETVEKKLNEIMSRFNSITGIDHIYNSATMPSTDDLLARMTDLVQENSQMKGKLATIKDYSLSMETENKANRETIMRLVNEAEQSQHHVSRHTLNLDNLKVERDNAFSEKRECERELEELRQRFESSQRAWQSTRSELERRDAAERNSQSGILAAQTAAAVQRDFKGQLARLLSDQQRSVQPHEEEIRAAIQEIVIAGREREAHRQQLEQKVSSLSERLDAELRRNRSSQEEMRLRSSHINDYKERLHTIEGELIAGDLVKDTLRVDKKRYMKFLEQVMQMMKIEPVAADVGFEMICDTILTRADQLQKLEGDSLVDRKTHIYSLQRKLKSMKEQLESKDVHLEMMRKKLACLEETVLSRSGLEREKDDEIVRSRKLGKLIERYKRELTESQTIIRDLKARLLVSSDIKNQNYEQERELEQLESKVDELQEVREKQARRIAGMRGQVDQTMHKMDKNKNLTSNTIHALSSELRTTKAALEELTKRERQLLDLRQVIARMLGLDVNMLAVPDYEIIARLEKLVLANQSNAATVVALDTAIDDMEDGFRAGYEDASRLLSMVPRAARTRAQRGGATAKTRSRSLSPSRRRDTRVY